MPGRASVLILVVMAGGAVQAVGQNQPYKGLEARDIKALSVEQVEAYLGGEGMGLALAAELNRYPGPKHVLELSEDLGLSEEQMVATREAFEEMRGKAQELGRAIVDRERRLDRLFKEERISEEALEELVGVIALLKGRLRVIHLRAHLRMVQILTPNQIETYAAHRGYRHGTDPEHPMAHHAEHPR